MLGQSFAYAYDLIGNRTAASRDNEEMSYTANTLNQYTQRTVGDLIDVLGSAETGTTVTVNNQAASRYEKYWHCGIGVTNSSDAVWQEINVVGVYNPPGTNDPDIVTSETGHVFVAKTPETFTYDNDGNLLSDGRFNYTWDCENRLISAETLTNLPASVPRVRVEFEYDYMSRRISKTVGRRTGGGLWQLMGETSFLYDGWNVVSEICDDQSQITTNLYVWGLDLSGSLQGAGGIGGLLAAQLGTNTVFYTYDGNGNVSELINTLDGTIAAHYEYSPFGEVLVATGDLASKNPFQFSTKYFDAETGLNNYGYRYYRPGLGRWLCRDPIGEWGFFGKLFTSRPWKQQKKHKKFSSSGVCEVMKAIKTDNYLFVRNQPVRMIDIKGLKESDPCKEAETKVPHAGSTSGMLICYCGKLIGCVWRKDTTPAYKLYPGLLMCVQYHEDIHVKQNENIRCEPGKIYPPVFEPAKHNADECVAHMYTIECLLSEHEKACGTEYDPDKPLSEKSMCETAFWKLISSSEGFVEKYCDR